MDVGLYTDSLPDFTFEQALDIAADAGVTAIEIAVGGQSSAPHLRVDELLASAEKRAAFADAFASRGLRIAALNCSAWPLHPVDGAFHDDVITKTFRLASELGVSTVVSMSGTAGDGPGASTFNWVFMPWPEDAVAHGRRAWDAAVAYWQEKSRLAEACGVERIAFELHPLHVVYNVPTLQAFRAATSPRVGANMDPSHLMWMGMDPIVATRALTGALYHVHIKDTEIVPDQVAIAGVMDNRPFSDPAQRAWNFRTIGRAHDRAWWSAFLEAVADAGYDGALSIEQEDPYAGQEEGVREAAAYLADLLAERAGRKDGRA